MKATSEEFHIFDYPVSMFMSFHHKVKSPILKDDTETAIFWNCVLAIFIGLESLSFGTYRNPHALLHRNNERSLLDNVIQTHEAHVFREKKNDMLDFV